MRAAVASLIAVAVLAIVLVPPSRRPLLAQAEIAAAVAALTGQVSSPEEGLMEGVIVSAKRADSTLTISVVSDQQGRYRFPRARLEPGHYALRVRAVGYDLESAAAVSVVAEGRTTADLKLRKAADLAPQLTNAEW